MWNSLWNIYDGTDGAPEPKASPSSAPSTPRIVGNPSRGGGRSNAAAASGSRGGHGETIDNRTPNLQTSLHSTSSNNSNSKRQIVNIKPPPPSDNTTILRGIIVGEEQSGKTCLIRRLRGEDPFLQNRGQTQPGDGKQNGSNNAKRRSQRNLMALIPWKIQEAPFHQNKHHTSAYLDDPVQLYVSEGKSFCYSHKEKPFQKQWISVLQPQRGKECDFVVWMIDPRMDNVLDFFQEGLDILFPSTVPNKNGKDGKSSVESIKQPMLQNLCVLLNFRDLNDPTQQNDESKASLLKQMQDAAEQVIDRHTKCHKKLNQSPATAATDTNPAPTILVYESSMSNCYGLQNLHSFITLPYLSHKERELRRRAEHARKQHLQWKQGLTESKVVGYSDFVEQILPTQKQPTNQSLERQKLEEEKHRLQLRLKQQNQLLKSKTEKQESNEGNGVSVSKQRGVENSTDLAEGGRQSMAPVSSNDHTSQRKLFAKSRQPPSVQKALPPSAVTDHNNLESFFSDDEDDDQVETETNNFDNDSSDSSDDDASDDGDFYFDVSGTRCSHANKPPVRHENAFQKRKDTQIMKASDPNIDGKAKGNTVKEELKVDTPAEHPASMDEKEDVHANDTKSEHYKSSVSGDVEVKEEIDDQTAKDGSRNNTVEDGTCSLNESAQPDDDNVVMSGEEKNTRSPNKPAMEEEGEDHFKDTNSEHFNKSSVSDAVEVKEEVDDQTAESGGENNTSEQDSCSPDADALISGEEHSTRSPNIPAELADADISTLDNANGEEVIAEDTSKETAIAVKTKACKSSASGDHEAEKEVDDNFIDEPTSIDSVNKRDRNTLEPDTSSLNEPSVPDAVVSKKEETTNEEAVSENDDNDSSYETRRKQSRDGSCDATNAKSEDVGNDLKIDNDEEHTDNDVRVTVSTATAVSETNETKQQKHSDGILQSHLVMDSDDESTGPRKGRSTEDGKRANSAESSRSGEMETVGNSVLTHQYHESLSPKLSMPKQAIISTPVSSAALAAIDAAKREAEQMMAQSQSNIAPSTKREKKSKKKKEKDGDKKKTKKKKREKDKKPKD